MTTKELIRKEVERLQDVHADAALEWKTEKEAYAYSSCAVEFGNGLLSFLDTLPDEPEQPTRDYDEAYLKEKIAKASKSWEGVDVNKFMDEIRGREPVTECNDFDSLFDEFCDTHPDGMTLEECGRFFFSRGFSRGKMVATNDFDLALAQRYLIGFNDGKREPETDCNDLKKHTKEWVELMVGASFPEQDGDLISEEDYRDVIKKTALHFAEWQKRKMMEGAVEGFVGVHLHDKRADVTVNSGYLPKEMGIKGDSKVKIIIVKEDKK